jgi:Protein of unknown function DUF58
VVKRGRKPRLDWLRRACDVLPLTLAGLLAAGGSLFAYLHYGRGRLDHLLLALGLVGLAVIATAVFFVIVAALLVWRAARRDPGGEPLRAECGHLGATGFRLPALRFLPFVHVRWSWIEPRAEVVAAREGGRLVEQVRPVERDHFERIVRRIEVGEVFGFARIAFRVRQERAGRFAPWMGGLEQIHLAQGLAGGDEISHPDGPPTGDFFDMRRYGAGDPIRFILWKVFAKTRTLMVRTPENALSPDRRTVAYLVAGDGDEPAAGAARVAVSSGALGSSWLLGADGCGEPASSREEAIEVLARSARAAPDDTGALAGFLGKARGGVSTRAVVFVPARPGPWLERVAAAARGGSGQSRARVEFVVCTDGLAVDGRRSRWARAVLGPEKEGGEGNGAGSGAVRHDDLLAVVSALGATGASVLVVDRPGGRVVSGSSLARRGGES